MRIWALDDSVEAESLGRGYALREGRWSHAGNQKLTVGKFGVQEIHCCGIELPRKTWVWRRLPGAAIRKEIRVERVGDALCAAVIGQMEGDSYVFGGRLGISDAYALVRPEKEELVLLDGAAQGSAKLVTVKEWLGNPSGVVEKRGGVHIAILKLFPNRAVEYVGARSGENADMRAAIVPLRSVIHGGVHRDFLDGVRGRRWKGLTDGSVDGCAGLDGAA